MVYPFTLLFVLLSSRSISILSYSLFYTSILCALVMSSEHSQAASLKFNEMQMDRSLIHGDMTNMFPSWSAQFIANHPELGNPSTLVGIGVEPTLSVVGEPLCFGVFAKLDIAEGTLITNYGGIRLHAPSRRSYDETASHTITCGDGTNSILDGRPSRSAIQTYTPTKQIELDAILLMPIDTFGYDPILMTSHLGPLLSSGIGYLVNTAAQVSNNNARYHNTRVRVPGGLEYILKVVKAKRLIKKGEQITCAYNIHRPTTNVKL